MESTKKECAKCSGKGYYHMMYKAESGSEEKSMMMYCVCEDGLQLRQIMLDTRLADLSAFAKEVLPRIEKIERELHKPDEAGKDLKALQDDIRLLMSKVEKAANEM